MAKRCQHSQSYLRHIEEKQLLETNLFQLRNIKPPCKTKGGNLLSLSMSFDSTLSYLPIIYWYQKEQYTSFYGSRLVLRHFLSCSVYQKRCSDDYIFFYWYFLSLICQQNNDNLHCTALQWWKKVPPPLKLCRISNITMKYLWKSLLLCASKSMAALDEHKHKLYFWFVYCLQEKLKTKFLTVSIFQLSTFSVSKSKYNRMCPKLNKKYYIKLIFSHPAISTQ